MNELTRKFSELSLKENDEKIESKIQLGMDPFNQCAGSEKECWRCNSNITKGQSQRLKEISKRLSFKNKNYKKTGEAAVTINEQMEPNNTIGITVNVTMTDDSQLKN